MVSFPLAAQLSDLGGDGLEAFAWGISLTSALVLALTWEPIAKHLPLVLVEPEQLESRKDLGAACLELHADIVQFLDKRLGGHPKTERLRKALGVEPSESEALRWRLDELTYDIQTTDLYEDKFAARVFQVVEQAHDAGYLSDGEVQKLNYPKNDKARRATARRLQGLGKRLS